MNERLQRHVFAHSFAFIGLVSVGVMLCMATLASAAANPNLNSVQRQDISGTERALDASLPGDASRPAAEAGESLREGDKLRLAFYERFDDDEQKWRGSTRSPEAGFHQFVELCGDYVVQDDGTISLPILGRFKAVGPGRDRLLADLSKSFVELVGHKGFVNLITIEHQPVYVVGPVRNPGSYKYVQGMTVLHAIALAGGLRKADTETWQRVEGGREIERLQRSLEKVKRLLVRTNLLKAEGSSPGLPAKTLLNLVGHKDLSALTDEETSQRKLAAQSRAATEASLVTALKNAQADVTARTTRLKPLDDLITIREQREKTISQLVDHATISRPVLVQAQSELADVEDRKVSALIEVDAAKSHLAEAERELDKFRVESSVTLGRATASTEQEAVDAVNDSEGTLDLIKALTPKTVEESEMTYEVARRTSSGTVVVNLVGTSPLEPGDLVQLKKTDAQTE